MRKDKEFLERLKKKYGVDQLWSWSKYNSYKTDPYGYLLKYILKEKETKHSIYAVSGGACHDIVERFYGNELKYEDMINEYELKLFEMNMAGLKYNRSDEVSNKKIADKYEGNIREFFRNHIPIDGKVIIEQFVVVKVGDHIMNGYVDFIHKNKDGKYVITDWKTSTIYSGQKILKEAGQLILYAEALIQQGVPIEDIISQWNFLKYCTVEQQLQSIDKDTKLNKTKNKNCLRSEWVKGVESNLRKWLEKAGYYELDIEDMIQTAIANNNMDNIPEDIRNRYKIFDCYVQVPLTQEVVDDLKENIINTIEEINEKEKEYLLTKDDKLFWTTIDKGNEYYFNNLCGYSTSVHKPYKEYIESINLGNTNKSNDGSESKIEDDDDLSWLNDL